MAKSLNIFSLLLALMLGIQEVDILFAAVKCITYSNDNKTNGCSDDIPMCRKTTECNGGSSDDNDYDKKINNSHTDTCYTIYRYDGVGGNFVHSKSGCNYNYMKDCEKPGQNKCVFKPHANIHEWYICCCFGDLCNKNLNFTLIKAVNIQKNRSDVSFISTVRDEQSRWILIIPVTVFTLIVLIGLFILFMRRHLRKRRRHLDALLQKEHNQYQESVEMHEIIHKGQFNSVWKALYRKQLVAVKIFTVSSEALWEAEKDIYTNCNLSHENILKFVSAEHRQQEDAKQYWIVTEYADYGSLTDYLSYVAGLDYNTMLQMMISIISGLTYLHSEDLVSQNKKPIIAHRDLKSRNVLVKQDLTCCIGDFGSAVAFHNQLYEGNNTSKLRVGTKRYMAPELLQGAVAFHVAAVLCTDNYSLALVLWELLSRCNLFPVDSFRLPYESDVGKNPNIYEMRSVVVEKAIRPTLKKEWVEHEDVSEICSAIESCWDGDADARLSASCLLMRFSQLLLDSQKQQQQQQQHNVNQLDSMNNEIIADDMTPLNKQTDQVSVDISS